MGPKASTTPGCGHFARKGKTPMLPCLLFRCPLLFYPSKFSANIFRFFHLFLFSQANKLVKYLLVKDQTKIPIKRSGSLLTTFLLKLFFLLSTHGLEVTFYLYGLFVLSYLHLCPPYTSLWLAPPINLVALTPQSWPKG